MEKSKLIRSRFAAMQGTRWQLFETAINMFADRGYANVGVRDIAAAVGVRTATLYTHFKSKDEILERAFSYFHENHTKNLPPLEEVLAMIPGNSPRKVLEKLLPTMDIRMWGIFRKILLIAYVEWNNDRRAEKLIWFVISNAKKRITAVLQKMMDLDLIEPVDIEMFVSVYTTFSIASASKTGDRYALPYAKWKEGRLWLFDLIKEKKK